MSKSYSNPIGSRYTGECSGIWSENVQRRLWRYHWLNTVSLLQEAGVFPQEPNWGSDEVQEIAEWYMLHDVDDEYRERAQKREAEIGHDVVAELETFQQEFEQGNPIKSRMHAVQTSSNVKDMAFIDQSIASLYRILEAGERLASHIFQQASRGLFPFYVIMQGRTHLQEADITTYGYRMLVHVHRMYKVLEDMGQFISEYEENEHPNMLVGGPTGTYGNLKYVAGKDDIWLWLEDKDKAPTFQTYDRTFDLKIAQMLSRLGSLLYKFGQDLRLMLSYGDMKFKNRGAKIQGSSSMPTKENPIFAEKACALIRHLPTLEREIWDYASFSMLERTLDDSAVRRYALPEMFQSLETAISSLRREFDDVEVNMSGGRRFDLRHMYATRIQAMAFANLDGKLPESLDREWFSTVDWSDEDDRLAVMSSCHMMEALMPDQDMGYLGKLWEPTMNYVRDFEMPDVKPQVRAVLIEVGEWAK